MTAGTSVVVSGLPPAINATDLPDSVVVDGLTDLRRELGRWIDNVRASGQRSTMFDRTQFAVPDSPYDRMRAARLAVESDDVVSNVADVTEALIFQGSKVESRDPDAADVFNQIWSNLNGDDVLRTWYRELFTYSQAIIGIWWGRRSYQVRGFGPPEQLKLEKVTNPDGSTSYHPPRDPVTNQLAKPKKGQRRRKTFDVTVPVAMTFLDPLKVVPVGTTIFGADQLAWHATTWEIGVWNRVVTGEVVDPIMDRWFVGKYAPENYIEMAQLAQLWGVDPYRLILLDPNNVFRHCRTKPDYTRFPDLRLRRLFQLLDLKQQLLEADRVMLIGAANYILLVRKGTEKDPALQPELDNLNNNMRVLAKLPVIVSDHRLEIQIIVPPQDHTLNRDRYDVLNHAIHDAAMGSLISQNTTRADTTLTTARTVGRSLESIRHMIKRAIEREVFAKIVAHPENRGVFDEVPNLTFMPRNIALDTEQQVVQAMMTLRAQKEISRETILEYFGLDEEVEAQRRTWEEESGLDLIFGTSIPFNSPDNGQPQNLNGAPPPPGVTGPQGGRPPGGGTSPQSPQSQVKPRTGTGAKSTGAK